jgi:hypothetical protein
VRESTGTAPSFLTSAVDRGTSFTPLPFHPLGKETSVPTGYEVGLTVDLNALQKNLALPGI